MLKLLSIDVEGTHAVSLEEAKRQCYIVSNDYEDDMDILLSGYIHTALEVAQAQTWRAIVPSTYQLNLDEFPEGDIELPKPPVKEVVSIKYKDSDGVLQTLDSSLYETDLDSEPARIRITDNWPAAKANSLNAVQVVFSAGYDGADDRFILPLNIKQAVLMLVKHFYDNRDAVVPVGKAPVEIPFAISALLGFESNRTFV